MAECREGDEAVSTLILHAYGQSRPMDQQPTWAYLDTIRGDYTVIDRKCVLPDGYAALWREHWNGPETLVNIEHDMEPDPGMLEALLCCPEAMCGQAYWLPALSTGRTEALCCAFKDDFQPLKYGETQARAMGLGLVKLTPEARRAIGMPDLVRWNQLDYEIFRRVRAAGLFWHVHWPACIHNHGFKQGENEKLKEYRALARSLRGS